VRVRVAPIVEKMVKNRLRWIENEDRRSIDYVIRIIIR